VAGKKRARVLVADDDPIILRLLELNLGLEGFDVATTVSGEDALRMAFERPPDLVLLDVMMPGVSGWDVARALRDDERTADVPVVFLSARTLEEDRRRGEDLGMAAYVTKPFDPAGLMQLVGRVIRAAQS
jgi:CheY-like chemotaxis protein